MSHLLDFTTGDAAIAYRGDVPWHGYGFAMPENAPIEEWLKAARLDWHVRRRPVYTQINEGMAPVEIPYLESLMRSDTNSVLSVVSSNRYKLVQPRDVLEFFRDLVDEHGFEIETAGALADGKRVWALAKTGETFNLGGADPVRSYVLLSTSYDKQSATTGQFTGVRVVCNNTIQIALNEHRGDSMNVFRVPHCTEFDPQIVKAGLGLLSNSWAQFTKDIELLANTPISDEDAVRFFLNLTGWDESKNPQQQMESNYLARKLVQAAKDAPGSDLPTANGTLWGIVNAVTYFTDHKRRATNAGTRLNSAWFGPSAQLKKNAWDMAMKMTEGLDGANDA